MNNWNAKEQKRYNDIYKHSKQYGVSEFDDYAGFFPEIANRKLRVMDLGCGAAHLSKEYDSYTGVDISGEIVSRNRKTLTGHYYVASLGDLKRWEGWKYDVVFCNDVMEHVPIEMTGLVIKEISKLESKYFYFKIHKGKSNHEDDQGNLHRTIQTHEFWHGLLSNWFNIEKDVTKGKGLEKGYLSYFKCTKK